MRIARAAAIKPPESPFYPVDDCVPKGTVHSTCNALHKVTPSVTSEGRLCVKRREGIIGWPGLEFSKDKEKNHDLPELLSMGSRNVEEVDHSLIAMAIRQEAELTKYPLPTLVVGFALWSDSCDPSTSLSKNNRGSVWALLLTMCCRIANVNPFSYTYLLSVGASVRNLPKHTR